jgi:hypothetical protein
MALDLELEKFQNPWVRSQLYVLRSNKLTMGEETLYTRAIIKFNCGSLMYESDFVEVLVP